MNNLTSKIIANGILRAIGVLVGIAAILFLLYKIQAVIVYVTIAAILSLIALPFVGFLHLRLKFPNILAVVTTMFVFILIILGLISLFVPLILEQGRNISILNTDELHTNIKQLLVQIDSYFSNNGIDVLSEIKNMDLKSNLKIIPSLFNSVLTVLGSLSMGLFSVLFITFFLLKDDRILYNIFIAVTPDNKEERILNSFRKISPLLSRYFIGLIVQLSILFAIYSLILLSFGVKSAIVIAFLAALLNIIPYIGPLIGGVLMLTLTMTSNLEYDFQTYILPTTLYVFIGYIIAQLIDNFFSQPLIFSKSVKSHPLEIFLVIIISGLLFGIVGMILAVPSYTAIKVILKEFIKDNEVVKLLTKQMD